MDKFLRPEKLDADPNSNAAAREWQHWFKTFQNFITSLNDNTIDKLNLLVNFVSPTVYEYISECDTYVKAIDALQNLYVRPKNEVYARHLLSSRRQQTGESLDEFLQALKHLSKDCNFMAVSAVIYKEQAIRDAFISGLISHPIRQRLLENKTLDLSTAFDQARSLDQAQKNSNYYSVNPSTSAALHEQMTEVDSEKKLETFGENVPVSAAGINRSKCFFCGNNRHPRANCPARDVTCNKCSKRGHFAKVCRSNKSDISASIFTPNIVLASVGELTKATIDAKVNDYKVKALIDTGSTESFISKSITDKIGLKIVPSNSVVSMASTSLQTQICGYCIVELIVKGKLYPNSKLSVMPDLCKDIILGQDFMKQHESISVKFGGSDPPLHICGLTSFSVTPPKLFGNLTSDCKPIATKSRQFSNPDKIFIQTEISRMIKEGIIEHSTSPWRAQVLVTTNERHKKRMVVDYSQTINKYTLLDAYPLPKINELINKVAQYRFFSTVDLKSAYHQVPLREEDKIYTAFEACQQLYQFRRCPFGVTNGVACFQRIVDQFIKDNSLCDTYAYLDDITICGRTKLEHDTNLDKFMAAAAKFQLTLNTDKCVFSSDSVTLLGYTILNGTIKPDPERLRPLIELPVPCDINSMRRAAGMFSYYSQWISDFSGKIAPLISSKNFPLSKDAIESFQLLKKEVEKSMLFSINEDVPFVVETDASDHSIAATLNQSGRPVAFFSRTLNISERKHSSIEKEAYAIVEAVRKWRHFLSGRHFNLITDQKSVSFMFDTKHSGKIKNDKIQRWRIELSCYSFDIKYRPGKENAPADALSRAVMCSAINSNVLRELHDSLCHPGTSRMMHFVRIRNLPFSVEDVKRVISNCTTCSKCKPQFYKPEVSRLIKATSPFERLSVDFKGPLPSSSHNKYLLTIIDEFSRFPFAFSCPNMTSETVIKCFSQLFSIFGMPAYIHSDRGSSFMSTDVRNFLHSRGIATSRTTPYNPQGNGQCERYNGIIWKSISLALNSKNLPIAAWECVMHDALHSIRTLLCTATNETPHERMFKYQRRSTTGSSVPTWLTTPGPVLLRRYVKQNKYEPSVDEVDLIEANPNYAHVRFTDGRESTVSIRDLAPKGDTSTQEVAFNDVEPQMDERGAPPDKENISNEVDVTPVNEQIPQRKSDRVRRAPDRLMYN